MKQFMLDFKNGFREGCLDLLWLVEEIVMWARVILAYVVSAVLTVPVAILYLVAGLVLTIGKVVTLGKVPIIEGAMVNLLFVTGILMVPAGVAFSWLIPARYIMMLYLRKTEELKEETETW